jgi:hypothetical protein
MIPRLHLHFHLVRAVRNFRGWSWYKYWLVSLDAKFTEDLRNEKFGTTNGLFLPQDSNVHLKPKFKVLDLGKLRLSLWTQRSTMKFSFSVVGMLLRKCLMANGLTRKENSVNFPQKNPYAPNIYWIDFYLIIHNPSFLRTNSYCTTFPN